MGWNTIYSLLRLQRQRLGSLVTGRVSGEKSEKAKPDASIHRSLGYGDLAQAVRRLMNLDVSEGDDGHHSKSVARAHQHGISRVRLPRRHRAAERVRADHPA